MGDYLYAAGDSSLSVAPLHCGSQLSTEPVFPEPEMPPSAFHMSLYPNPFNPSLDVRYEVAEPSLVRISIRDLAGRTVARAARGYQGRGDHVWTWNGRDSGGRDLPAGVYLITVQCGLKQLTQKAALVR